MDTPHDDNYDARCAFQRTLDRSFPRGAVCAILPVADGRVQAAGTVEATGRLFCSDARPGNRTGWNYELLIDTRTRIDAPADEMRLWIDGLQHHPTVDGLWEAPITGDGGHLLRLNAAAPAKAMPGAGGREAVTLAHETDLFPEGIRA